VEMEDNPIEIRPFASTPDKKEEKYEQLYIALNEYRFGRIDFLELLKRWEDILHISPST